MTDADIPPDVMRLIQDALPSMDHVEVLFSLHRDQPATPEELAAKARIDVEAVKRILRDLDDAKVVTEQDGTYRITDGTRDRIVVDSLVEMYNTRPATLVRAIYARVAPLKRFDDAFRTRRKD